MSRQPAAVVITPKHLHLWTLAGIWCGGRRTLEACMADQRRKDP